jgi:hypothetical protein
MEKLTKEQRHDIYVKALIEAEKDDGYPFGLCIWIYWVMDVDYCDMDEFPEILLHKPRKKYSVTYWFNPTDKQIRIDILKQAIKETE